MPIGLVQHHPQGSLLLGQLLVELGQPDLVDAGDDEGGGVAEGYKNLHVHAGKDLRSSHGYLRHLLNLVNC